MNHSEHKKIRTPKTYLLLFTLPLLLAGLTGLTGGTVAYLFRQETLTQTFETAVISCEVLEKEDGSTAVRNTGDTDVFVRAAVLVHWQDEDGNVRAFSPKNGEDYILESASDDWFTAEDGFRYCTKPLEPDAEAVLFREVNILTDAPAGYRLITEIYAEAIQSEPPEAIQSVWNRTVEDGEISE